MTIAELWPLVSIIVVIFGALQAVLAFYMRSLIDHHTLHCPWAIRQEKAQEEIVAEFRSVRKEIMGRIIAGEEKLERHLEVPGRHLG